MRAVVVLALLAPFAAAAPVPKKAEKPRVELAVARTTGPIEFAVTVTNNGKDELSLKYTALPIELFEIDVRTEGGAKVPFDNPALLQSLLRRGTLTVPAGGSAEVGLRLIPGLFRNGGRPKGKLFVTVRLTHDDVAYESKPLPVDE